jgi:hypothetical protein
MLRLFALAGCLLAAAAVIRAEVPAALRAALEKSAEGRDRWAYTETRTNFHPDGTVKDETIFRIDPSRPYPEQTVPIKIRGRAPSEKDFKKYRERGEKKADARERAEKIGQPMPVRSSRMEAFDLENASLVAEDDTTATYLVPLRKTDRQPFPPEKFEAHVRLNKKSAAMENVSLKLKGAVRAKLIAKLKSGHASLDFTPVHPDFPPVMTSIQVQGTASVLFKSFTQSFSVKRTDLRRVRPYDERFEVRLGPAEALDF